MMWKEDQATQEAAVRALANMAAPAGIISESAESLLQRQKAEEGNEPEETGDNSSSEVAQTGSKAGGDGEVPELKLKLETTRSAEFELVGRFGSSFVAPEDYEEEAQLQPGLSLEESLFLQTVSAAELSANQEEEESGGAGADGGEGEGNQEQDNDNDSDSDAETTCSSAPSAVSSSESVQLDVAGLAIAAADEARARATTAATAARKERSTTFGALNNDPSWWGTAEGAQMMLSYNQSALDRIHLKVIESAVFTDLFNPTLP
jgi:hypothetical protein